MRLVSLVLLILVGGYLVWVAMLNNWVATPGGSSEAMTNLGQTPLIGPTGDTPDRAGDWGDVVINKTQLSRFVDQYGVEATTVGMGELELGYHGRQAMFTFQAVGECQRQMQFMSPRVPAMSFMQNDGVEFFNQAPACREEMPLRDIQLRFDAVLSSRFMQAPIYIPQVSTEFFIEPSDDVFDVVRKFGLPPRSYTTEEPVGISGFREYTALAYPGVSVLYRGSYEYVTQWHRYAGAVSTAQDLAAAINRPAENPEAQSGQEQLRRAMAEVMQESGANDGIQLLSDFEDKLAPKIALVRLTPTPSEAIVEAQRNQY